MKSIHTLAQRLPDIPRRVEIRALLRWGRCEIFGLEETPSLAFAIRDPATGLVGVVGTPSVDAIREATENAPLREPVIAPPEQQAHVSRALPEWKYTRAVLHTLPDFSRLPTPPPDTVRFLEPAEIRHLHEMGKQPVWGANTENTASANLARKLRFVPADELALWERY